MARSNALLRLTAVAVAVVLGFIAVPVERTAGQSESDAASVIELRVWQDVENGRNIHVSARAVDGLWGTLGIIPLPLDDGLSASGWYRYGDIALEVPLGNRASPRTVLMRVWQNVQDDRSIYISARLSTGSWDTLGTVPLALDDGLHSQRPLRYGDISLGTAPPDGDSSLRADGVASLAGRAGVRGFRDGSGDEARFGFLTEPLMGVTVDRDGSVVVADYRNRAIRRILPDGTVTTIAGGNGEGSRDGPAETAQFEGPTDVAIDPEGAIYVADCWADRVRKITPDGMVTTVTGFTEPTGTPLRQLDDPAEDPLFASPCGLALDPYGDLYIMEQTRIRRLSPLGWVTTFAGTGRQIYRDGPRGDAQFGGLQGIDVDAAGNVYVIDANYYVPGRDGIHYAVRRIDTSGWVATLFRSGPPWAGGVLAYPRGIAVTPGGEVYVTNTGRHQIVRIAGRDELVAVAGTGDDGYRDGPRDQAHLSLPGALAIAPGGALVVADQGDSMVRVVTPDADGSFTAVKQAVIPDVPRLQGVHVGAVTEHGGILNYPHGIALDADGGIIVADRGTYAIRRITPEGAVRTVAGGAGEGSRNGPREEAQFSSPRGVAVDAGGVVYVADTGNGLIRRVALDGTVTTFHGREQPLSGLTELALGPEGDLLFTQRGGRDILRLSADGEVSIVVEGDARITGLAVDDEGTVFYATFDFPTTSILRADGDGIVATVFEDRPGRYGGIFSHDLAGLAVAPDGTLYAVDREYGRVVRISPGGEAAIVVARDSFHDSRYFQPVAILVTPEGDLLVSDSGRRVIWKITLGNEAED